jgi:hypothetical protein
MGKRGLKRHFALGGDDHTMNITQYDTELDKLSETYKKAINTDIEKLKVAI